MAIGASTDPNPTRARTSRALRVDVVAREVLRFLVARRRHGGVARQVVEQGRRARLHRADDDAVSLDDRSTLRQTATQPKEDDMARHHLDHTAGRHHAGARRRPRRRAKGGASWCRRPSASPTTWHPSATGWPMPGGRRWRRRSTTARAVRPSRSPSSTPCCSLMGDLTAEGIRADVDAAIGHLGERGTTDGPDRHRRVLHGRRVALETATRRSIGAAVTFYGGGVAEGRFGFPSLERAGPRSQTPWLGLYGDLDKGIPPEQVEDLPRRRRRRRWRPRWCATPTPTTASTTTTGPMCSPTAAEDGVAANAVLVRPVRGARPAGGPD